MKTVAYKGWEKCVQFKNDTVTMIVTTEVGPRIIYFAFNDGENIFQNYEEMMGKTGGDEWTIYGGHRLWAAPENQPRTYYPDNHPVAVSEQDEFVRFTAPVENGTNIQKELDIYFPESGAEVKVIHRIINHNVWGIELSPWALSVMKPGGKCIAPFPPRGTHTGGDLLPSNTLICWSYTDMADSRWTWGETFFALQAQVGNEVPQKAGASVSDGWAAYLNDGALFVKYFDYMSEFMYPDMGANFETFTNESMLEVETLGPMSWLQSGEAVEHVEIWDLLPLNAEVNTDADVQTHILPLIQPK